MQNITGYIINGILFVGAGLLCVSFYPIQRLIGQLPKGALRRRWNDLRALILFFIAGYVSFTYLYWLKHDDNFNLIVPAVFFLGMYATKYVLVCLIKQILFIKRFLNLVKGKKNL